MVNLFFSSTAEVNGRHYRKKLGIDEEAIVSVLLSLDTGDISHPYDPASRREVYSADFRSEYSVTREIKNLERALKNDSQLCFWFSSKDINEYLGMIASVSYYAGSGYTLYIADCTDICPSLSKLMLKDDFCADLRCPLSSEKCGGFIDEWNTVQAENAPLRIIQNGKIIGLPADYVDDAIYFIMGSHSIKTSALFERFPWKNYPVSATFLNYRISQLISQGCLEVLELGWDPYGNYGAPMKLRAGSVINKHIR